MVGLYTQTGKAARLYQLKGVSELRLSSGQGRFISTLMQSAICIHTYAASGPAVLNSLLHAVLKLDIYATMEKHKQQKFRIIGCKSDHIFLTGREFSTFRSRLRVKCVI